jgi:hypothetical protein
MMERKLKNLVIPVLVALFVAGFVMPSANGQSPIKRFSAEFKNFDNTETTTALAVPGIAVYDKTITVGSDTNTLYVTISAVGDTHLGNGEFLSCNIDGVFCNPGAGLSAGAPAGWITVSKHFNYDNVTYNGGLSAGDGGGGTGDQHDNAIYYTWCAPVTPGVHTVEIRQASSLTGGGAGNNNNVFFEAAHFYIDGSKPVSACVAAK